MPVPKTLLLLISFALLSVFPFHGQEPGFTNYTVDNGLPSLTIHDVIQDKYGKLWFTTDRGLSCYDGYHFKNFTTEDGITDNSLFKFYMQENGDIWCTTHNKTTFCIRGNSNRFEPYRYNKLLAELPDYLISTCIYWSKDSSLFMALCNSLPGYIKIDKSGNVDRHIPFTPRSTFESVFFPFKQGFYYFIPDGNTEAIKKDWGYFVHCKMFQGLASSRPVYFEREKRAVFASSDKLRIQSPQMENTIDIPVSFEPISMGKYNDSLFWVGFRYGGLGIFNLSGKRVRSYLTDKSVTSLFIDHQGGHWVSTLNDGVFHLPNPEVVNYTGQEKADHWINSLTKDALGNLWVGHYNGNVSVFSGHALATRHLSRKKRPAIVEYQGLTNKIYYTTDYQLYEANPKQLLYERCIYTTSFLPHRHDSIMMTSLGTIGILHKGRQTKLMTNFRVNDICYHDNKFFLATNDGLYSLKQQSYERVNDSLCRTSRMFDLESWNGKLAAATGGLGILLKENNRMQKIDSENGLSSNLVHEIHIENDSILWACTNAGLNRIIYKDNMVRRIDVISVRNGLLSNEVTDVEIINDTAWVGTRQGLCAYPLSLFEKKTSVVNYFITLNYFKVNDSLFPREHPGELKFYQNRIEFGFKAISFNEPEPLLYRYKLAGYENVWHYTRALSTTYASLPPGGYDFIVQVKGGNPEWESMEQRFSFTISPPYWKTWWFVLIVISVVGILVYLFFRFRILSYNRDITRELLRQLLKRVTWKSNYVVFREQGKHIRIPTTAIYYVKADGNYIEIHTHMRKHVIRYKIGEFLGTVPDPLEYVRISRSCIVRIDKIEEKGKKHVTVKGETISVGETYIDQFHNIQF